MESCFDAGVDSATFCSRVYCELLAATDTVQTNDATAPLSVVTQLSAENIALESRLHAALTQNEVLRRYIRSTLPASVRDVLPTDMLSAECEEEEEDGEHAIRSPHRSTTHFVDTVKTLRKRCAEERQSSIRAKTEASSVASLHREHEVQSKEDVTSSRPASAPCREKENVKLTAKFDRTTQIASVDRLYTKDLEKRRQHAQRRKECERQSSESQWGRGALTAAQQVELGRRLHGDHKEKSARVAKKLRETYLVDPTPVLISDEDLAACNQRLFYAQGKKTAETHQNLLARYCPALLKRRVLTVSEMQENVLRLCKPHPRGEVR